jgi:hypothetical protein
VSFEALPIMDSLDGVSLDKELRVRINAVCNLAI